jgi:hypothetical protein
LGNNTKMKMGVPLSAAILLASFGAFNASASTLYSDLPGGYSLGANNTLPNADAAVSGSVPFDLFQISEFGGLVNLASTGYQALTGGTVALDNYATAAQYSATCGTTTDCATVDGVAGYYANLTVNIYGIGSPGATVSGDTLYPVVGPPVSHTTQVFIAWDPTANPGPTCPDGQPSFNTSSMVNQCGVINLVNFNLAATVPSSFIYTVSLTGNSYPGGNDGASDSLNFALNPCAAQDSSCATIPYPYVGVSSSDPDTAYYNEALGSCASGENPLTCGALAGDVGWSNQGYGEISFNGSSATPEPATFGLIGFGLLGLGISARKRNRKK